MESQIERLAGEVASMKLRTCEDVQSGFVRWRGPMKWHALKPFGARVELDLREPLDAADVDDLRTLYREHHLLLIRGGELTRSQQEGVLGYLAPVQVEELPYVSNVKPDEGLGTSAILFHSDFTWLELPYLALSLHALEATSGHSSTRFINTSSVYQGLPQVLKNRIAGLRVLQVQPGGFAERKREIDANLARAEHPLVLEDPASGLECLFVSPLDTNSVIGLDPEESEVLLQELFSHLYRPENVLEHFWEKGDLLIWNNLTLQHSRGNVSGPPRILQRASAGPRSMTEQLPHSVEHLPYSAKKAELTA